MKIETALISVSNKTGIVEFAKSLISRKIRILSTGGTAKILKDAGLDAIEVSEYTGFPEILDGRVKTLHPKIHGGLLAKRDKKEHIDTIKEYGIDKIDILVVNLYPFNEAISKEECTFSNAIENIDIGGPAMLRAASKNHGNDTGGVTVIVDPNDYDSVINEIDKTGKTSYELRLALATKAFAHTAAYDGSITNYLSSLLDKAPKHNKTPDRQKWPEIITIQARKQQSLRYGENPHQTASFYTDEKIGQGLLSNYKQIQGKELSFNNISDADAAWECVSSFDKPACVIVKHANPCGVAIGDSIKDSYAKAFKTDPISAFGGIVAFNKIVDLETARIVINNQFLEVLLAPDFDDAAIKELSSKQNIRVLKISIGNSKNNFDAKRVGGGWLLQTPDSHDLCINDISIVTKRQPTKQEIDDLIFAWNVAKFVKSNAIVFASKGMTLGIGAGQMSRVDSARIASIKAIKSKLDLKNSAVASDAFFPFRDGLDVIIESGSSCVIQPGGSVRDDEVIDAANEHGIVMAITGIRHFRH
ncbi:phosphoribosylaminoimidazolecarboxamide formyltransferase [Candidatus Kinetoplastibacterium blastocrithidii TCC012E]|uniref:Bifunctional purine biosynthesis protein PurH n=1 Tax=Candidatus Kinetoplastidibacterium blastocrithidiae TCC012E TaxID=1208922 RepID=M1ME07_9PROT|nr:bifunctional phosphoribosylaminoimidazolecarboxamide formyltransferase/IMP cyclohydrolase [Candidatus Kinetoplastibacterium blastocrithidii]AFZ83841.1 bifunctional phosphoribosylaminoimidazolecarboxamide formyltransferase/IMP cyclohydrolase [Candidatus Kinetoplastibacterium blastocrithidii (ex Strigomonas culicis)]AGF49965.1 phosphoribosylaminoimidazolecarboxamide formyltransferase [Candidatus Kinetoplastibacterium blastocrithidii TCC012E]